MHHGKGEEEIGCFGHSLDWFDLFCFLDSATVGSSCDVSDDCDFGHHRCAASRGAWIV